MSHETPKTKRRTNNFFAEHNQFRCRSKKKDVRNIRPYGNTKYWHGEVYENGLPKFGIEFDPNGLVVSGIGFKSPYDLFPA